MKLIKIIYIFSLHLAIIDLIIFVSLGVSNMLSGIILNRFGFLGSFIFMASCVVLSLLLTSFQLKESLSPEKRAVNSKHWIKSPKKIYILLTTPRSQKWRLKFLIAIDCLFFVVGQAVLGPIILLRLLNFCWSSTEIGIYRGAYFFISGIGGVFAVKVIPKFFHKVIVILLSILSSFGFCLLLGLFESRLWYYIGKNNLNKYTYADHPEVLKQL